MNCIFCKIVKGDIHSTKIYENDKFLCFLDIQPANKGHTLVIPKHHHATALDMDSEEFAEMMKLVHRVAGAVVKAVNPEGYNLIINNGEASGQEVPHVHCHIMPRFSDDFKMTWGSGKYEEAEMEEYKGRIDAFM